MVAFQNYSIRKKLMAMSLLASSGALLLASGVFMSYDFISSRSALVRNLSTIADIISFNTSSAILFNDAASAEKTLTSLQGKPGLLSASIYTPAGELFASWQRNQNTSLPGPPPAAGGEESYRFHRDVLVLFHNMVFDKSPIGI